jgi:KUP system potassium uptake protein
MVVWFVTLGGLGLFQIVRHPSVLAAVSPTYALQFLFTADVQSLAVLGAVVLCITGCEALYADMGHFGRGPILIAWYSLVLPGLLLVYFGQGALVLENPDVPHTFWHLVPSGAPTLMLVVLATAATIIASQAMISGSYSLARQAVQLGFLPRVTVVHTSSETEGQIYVPQVNWALMVACLVLVVGFSSASALAGAYGLAVTGTMLITSLVFLVVALRKWQWSPWKAVPIVALFCLVDATFLVASIHKIPDGGWVPLALGAAIFTMMLTWKQGKALVAVRTAERTIPLEMLAADLATGAHTRVRGTGIFMAPDPHATPLALLHFFKHAKVLQENVIALSIEVEPVPWVGKDEAATVKELGSGIHNVSLHFGFMQTPNVPVALSRLFEDHRLPFDPGTASYFVGHETLLPTGPGRMLRWRKVLFEFLSRNVPNATTYFRIPPNQVIELGAQIAL